MALTSDHCDLSLGPTGTCGRAQQERENRGPSQKDPFTTQLVQPALLISATPTTGRFAWCGCRGLSLSLSLGFGFGSDRRVRGERLAVFEAPADGEVRRVPWDAFHILRDDREQVYDIFEQGEFSSTFRTEFMRF